ncbi:unnamed protein product, partial [Cylicostephanus goldi]
NRQLLFLKVLVHIFYVSFTGNGCIEIDEFLQVLRRQLLSPREERELKEVFEVFDKDADGFISSNDLIHLMHSLGEALSESMARDMIREGDYDHDGLISFNEFVTLIKGRS